MQKYGSRYEKRGLLNKFPHNPLSLDEMVAHPFGTILQTFEHPLVRDLYWAMFSPPLLDDKVFRDALVTRSLLERWEIESRPWLYALDKNPTPLQSWMLQLKTRRLGYLFEHLVHFFLREAPFIQLEYHNLQYPAHGVTEGEIDFIFQYDGKRYHWEVAVKYYCQTAPTDAFEYWIGPSANDRLDIKWNHLITHQLRMSQHFPQLNINCSQAFLKGKWYLPSNGVFPSAFHPEALHGEVFRLDEFRARFAKDDTFTILMRPYWLSDTVFPSNRIPTVFRDDVHTYFRENPQKLQSVHIGWWDEATYRTAFIVADSWPQETDFSHKRFRRAT